MLVTNVHIVFFGNKKLQKILVQFQSGDCDDKCSFAELCTKIQCGSSTSIKQSGLVPLTFCRRDTSNHLRSMQATSKGKEIIEWELILARVFQFDADESCLNICGMHRSALGKNRNGCFTFCVH